MNLTKADRVKIHVALSFLKRSREESGGWEHEMKDLDRLLDFFYDHENECTSYEKLIHSVGESYDKYLHGMNKKY